MDPPPAAAAPAPASDKDSPAKKRSETETKTEGVALPPNLMKAIRRRSSSVIGSTSSNGGGSGNNSDNSGLVSIGNNSFGFNFDSEEGKTNESDSGEDAPKKMPVDSAHGSETSEEGEKPKVQSGEVSSSQAGTSNGAESSSGSEWKSSVSSLTQSSSISDTPKTEQDSHHAAAAAVVANLHSIASQHSANENGNDGKFCGVRPCDCPRDGNAHDSTTFPLLLLQPT